MTQRTLQFAIPVVTLIVGALGGFAAGQQQGIGMLREPMKASLSVELQVKTEVASLIRVGDQEGALARLEPWIDAGITSLALHADTPVLTRGLGVAKAYRAVVPSGGTFASQVNQILSQAPEVKGPFFCPTPAGGETVASGLDRLTSRGRQ